MAEYSYLESITVVPGGEASWQGGELRFQLDEISIQRGWLDRLLRRRDAPAICEVRGRLATPSQASIPWGITTGFPRGFPTLCGPYFDDAPLLDRRRGPVFQIRELVDHGRAAVVRAGFAEMAPDVVVGGELAALDPAAQHFVSWWLSQPSAQRFAAARNGALGYPVLDGYSLRLMASSTGALATTFHREGKRYYVRTCGGCIARVETWHGPFIEYRSGYRTPGTTGPAFSDDQSN